MLKFLNINHLIINKKLRLGSHINLQNCIFIHTPNFMLYEM